MKSSSIFFSTTSKHLPHLTSTVPFTLVFTSRFGEELSKTVGLNIYTLKNILEKELGINIEFSTLEEHRALAKKYKHEF